MLCLYSRPASIRLRVIVAIIFAILSACLWGGACPRRGNCFLIYFVRSITVGADVTCQPVSNKTKSAPADFYHSSSFIVHRYFSVHRSLFGGFFGKMHSDKQGGYRIQQIHRELQTIRQDVHKVREKYQLRQLRTYGSNKR